MFCVTVSTKPLCTVIDYDHPRTKISRAAWLGANKAIIAAYGGELRILDPEVCVCCVCRQTGRSLTGTLHYCFFQDGSTLSTVDAHASVITGMVFNKTGIMMLTCSSDKTAKVCDVCVCVQRVLAVLLVWC